MAISYISLGSNLGRRRSYILQALKLIKELKQTRIIKASPIIETKPLGGPKDQRDFLNAVVKLETFLSCPRLLKELKTIEKKLGRKESVRWGPRTVDLDILFYGGSFIQQKSLKVPHPQISKRHFLKRLILHLIQ